MGGRERWEPGRLNGFIACELMIEHTFCMTQEDVVMGSGSFGSPFSVIPAKAGIQSPLLQRSSGFPRKRERRDKDFENRKTLVMG